MILLESGNRVLQDSILQIFNYEPKKNSEDESKSIDSNTNGNTLQRDPVNINLCDYDSTTYKLSIGGSGMCITVNVTLTT